MENFDKSGSGNLYMDMYANQIIYSTFQKISQSSYFVVR